ncbi:MAG TPA: hypothetical protein VN419_08195 [Humidesulfovibrio sp.]|uniref:hypothetical protein n=1 Tax=Humidesulfovibrio sp. TaxID=2910988 RepID=UPI002CF35238|nr:hypothetical protein [Humidesulfovibrio sp.]HWR03989.1 hypothetical protein [Humidesulfovibrio sp.]
MRARLRIFVWLLGLCVALALAGCADPGLERVDVTWETDPPPRWGLYPGYRQEIPAPKGASYRVDVFFKGKAFTGGTVSDAGYALNFAPSGKDIEAERDGRDRMTLYATLRNSKGESRKLTALRISRKDDKLVFEFPK